MRGNGCGGGGGGRGVVKSLRNNSSRVIGVVSEKWL